MDLSPAAAAAPALDLGPTLRAGGAAIALPAALAARAFGPAWIVALAAHFALVAVALVGPGGAPAPEEPPVRLVFFEPPPPPPAPLGLPEGAGTLHAPVLPKAPDPVVERPEKAPETRPAEPKRLRRAEPKAKPKPRVEPKPAVESRREVAAAEVAPGISTGSVGGVAGGVTGGVVGGVAGGVVGGSGSGPIPAGQVAHPPVLVRRVAPAYPQQARQRNVEGLVLLEAILDRDGRVEPNVKVLESIPMLDAEAVAAVRRWRFRPARNQGGEPLRVILEIPIRFVLR